MMKSCYQNILESSTVSLSQGSQNNSYPLYRLYDRDIGRMFAGSAAATTEVKAEQGALIQNAIDSLFIPAGHNLGGMQCNLSFSDDDTTYTQAFPNLLPYSQDFENAWWQKDNTTVTADAGADPLYGTRTADQISDGTATGIHDLFDGALSVYNGVVYTFSIYAKYISMQYLQLTMGRATTSAIYANFDIKNGLVSLPVLMAGSGAVAVSAKITPVDGGWYRCEITGSTNDASYLRAFFNPSDSASFAPSYTGNNNTIYLWGAQLEAAPSNNTASNYNGTFGSAQTLTPSGSGLIQYGFPQAMTHRYWKFTITNPSVAPQFAELFLTSTYTWEKLPARPGGPFDDVFNVKNETTASGLDRFLVFGNSRRQRVYKVVNAGATQQANILALNAAWAGSKPFWLYDHEGNWIYGRLRKPIGLKETGAGKFGFDFDFLEVLGS